MVHGWLRGKTAQGSGVALLLPLYFLQRSRLVEALHAYQELQQSGAAQGEHCSSYGCLMTQGKGGIGLGVEGLGGLRSWSWGIQAG